MKSCRLSLVSVLCAGLLGAVLAGAVGVSASPSAFADNDINRKMVDEHNSEISKLPLPRFVSLRTDEVNMRAGPGVRYPVDWVYMRRDLPVEIVAEFDVWRKIRDPDGAEGWVHQSMLSGRRMMMVKANHTMLRRTADDTASAAAWLQAGVVGKVLQCPQGSAFCRVEVQGYPGWLRRDEIWGVFRSEVVE